MATIGEIIALVRVYDDVISPTLSKWRIMNWTIMRTIKLQALFGTWLTYSIQLH